MKRDRSRVVREQLLLDLADNTRVAKFLGLLPVSLSGAGLAHSAPSILCTLLMVLLVSANVLFQLSHSSSFIKSQSQASTWANRLIWFYLNIVAIVLPMLSLSHRRSLCFIISNLTAFKENFKKKSIPWNSGRPIRVSICFDLYLLIIMILDMAFSASELADVSFILVYYLCNILLNENQSQFIWFAFNITEAYHNLRRSVDGMLSYKDFEILIKFQLKLSECCRELNNAYSMQFLLCFVTVFIAFLSGSFTVIVEILRKGEMELIVVCTFWVLNNLAVCCRIISACENLKKEAKTFDDVIYEKIIQDQAKNVTQPTALLNVFLHFLSNEPVTFTMFKFSVVNWSLLFSMVAGGITYLVFLIDAEMKQA